MKLPVVFRVNHRVKIFLISDVFYYMAQYAIGSFLSILVINKIAPGRLDIIGILISYVLILKAVFELPFSRLAIGWSQNTKKNCVAVGYLVYGSLIIFVGYSTNLIQLFMLQSLLALIEAITHPIKWTIFTDIMDKNKKEIEWGLEDFITSLIAAFSSIGIGILSQTFGLEIIFAVFGIMYILSGLSFFFVRNHHYSPPPG